MTPGAIDVGGLLELVWFAPLAAVAVTISYSLCVLGATRSTDARKNGDAAQGALWMTLAVVAGVTVTAGIVLGFGVISGLWGGE